MAQISKLDIIDTLANHNRLGSKAAATEVLDELLTVISNHISEGSEVYLGQAFGGFKPATQAAQSGISPSTGTTYSTPAKQVIKFKPSAALKLKIAGA